MTLGWEEARAIAVALLGGAATGALAGSAAASVAAILWLR